MSPNTPQKVLSLKARGQTCNILGANKFLIAASLTEKGWPTSFKTAASAGLSSVTLGADFLSGLNSAGGICVCCRCSLTLCPLWQAYLWWLILKLLWNLSANVCNHFVKLLLIGSISIILQPHKSRLELLDLGDNSNFKPGNVLSFFAWGWGGSLFIYFDSFS